MKVGFVCPSKCISFHDWVIWFWDIRRYWISSYSLRREAGFRFFGIEVSWEYTLTSEE